MITVIAYLREMSETKAENTVKNHRSTLTKFFTAVKVDEVIEVLPSDVMQFKKNLLRTGTVASTNTQLKRVKAFFKWCTAKGIMDFSPCEDVGLATETPEAPKWLSAEQSNALIRAIKRDYLGAGVAEAKKSYRELLIVLLMLKAGLRVGEVVGQKLSDIEITDRKASLYVRGDKREMHRTVPLPSDVVKVLKMYLDSYTPKGEYLFDSRQSIKLSERSVQVMLDKYKSLKTETATITELTPHMLRHTYAHDLANGGMAVESIARLLGHFKNNGKPNIQQTIRYTMKSNTEIADELEEILAIK